MDLKLKFKQMSEIDKCDYTSYFILILYNCMLLHVVHTCIYVNAQPMLFISFYNLIMTNITNGTVLFFIQRNIIN